MLAPSASTLPRGHILVEPYLYDVITQGQYDSNGVRRSAPHANGFGSLTYANIGVTDRFTVGMIPTAGYNQMGAGQSSSGIEFGDLTVQGQYRLRQFHEGGWLPTMSVAVQETLPTGKFDRLDRLSDGLGSGAFTTTVAFYSQTYFWLPNRRILRMRLNVSQAFSNDPEIEDVSVYGTQQGFRGHASPGYTTFVDGSSEYSLTRRWVLALDATYRYQGNTQVSGVNLQAQATGTALPTVDLNSGSTAAFGLAPAVEYSWTRSLGVLLGVRVIPAGRNTAFTVSPAVAINFVH